MDGVEEIFPPFLEKVVAFPDGPSFEIIQPLTRLRSCHDGTPAEACIIFLCKHVGQQSEDEFIMKVKVQEPDESVNSSHGPEEGPSNTTSAELKALGAFSKANNPHAPQLVAWKRAVQSDGGRLPGGYITYTVMTKMPGDTLFSLQFWAMPSEEREEIVRSFLPALRSIYALGIEPEDRALRNIMWDRETRKCSIIDFELWHETSEMFDDETSALQRWGLAKMKSVPGWFAAWKIQER